MVSFQAGAVGTGFRHMTLAREVKANARAAVHGFWRPVKVESHKLIQQKRK